MTETAEATERQNADSWFEKLVPLLASTPLPCENGSLRTASPDEFMFMGVTAWGGAFKHCDTRNYLYVQPNGKLLVPQRPEMAFHRGFFDVVEL